MKLTEVKFWDDYWKGYKLPNKVDFSFSFERCLANELKKRLPTIKGKVFEIGCAPGKWLAFFYKNYSIKVAGIEYSDVGQSATLKNFQLLNIKDPRIIIGDFFKLQPKKKYDVVMSYGFIEHFDDPKKVIDLHLRWLKPGGILILGVPNFLGIYNPIQKILDPVILDKHNLNIMNLPFFRNLEKDFNLQTKYIGYIGSFEPSLPIAKYKYGNPLQFFVRVMLYILRQIRKFKFFDKLNHKFFSSYILAIYIKR